MALRFNDIDFIVQHYFSNTDAGTVANLMNCTRQTISAYFKIIEAAKNNDKQLAYKTKRKATLKAENVNYIWNRFNGCNLEKESADVETEEVFKNVVANGLIFGNEKLDRIIESLNQVSTIDNIHKELHVISQQLNTIIQMLK